MHRFGAMTQNTEETKKEPVTLPTKESGLNEPPDEISSPFPTLVPIGRFLSQAQFKFEQPRQGTATASGSGIVQLECGNNFETALEDLAGFDRIWLIYFFHKNTGWRPKATPPIPPKDRTRVGLFASRSPYRPNPIGLSCVKLESISGLMLMISEADLLDGTPILDIKPYIPSFDAFPQASAGWIDEQDRCEFGIESSPAFIEQSLWVQNLTELNPESFARVQLSVNPFDSKRKRIVMESDHTGVLSYRTWRIAFSYDNGVKSFFLEHIFSGYSDFDLQDVTTGKWADKDIHRSFRDIFSRH